MTKIECSIPVPSGWEKILFIAGASLPSAPDSNFKHEESFAVWNGVIWNAERKLRYQPVPLTNSLHFIGICITSVSL